MCDFVGNRRLSWGAGGEFAKARSGAVGGHAQTWTMEVCANSFLGEGKEDYLARSSLATHIDLPLPSLPELARSWEMPTPRPSYPRQAIRAWLEALT